MLLTDLVAVILEPKYVNTLRKKKDNCIKYRGINNLITKTDRIFNHRISNEGIPKADCLSLPKLFFLFMIYKYMYFESRILLISDVISIW